MTKIVKFPNPGIPRQVSREALRAAPKPNDKQVWGVCPYLRDGEKCRGCPEWEDDPHYGKVQCMCRGLADEACRIVMAAGDQGSEG